MKILLAVVLTTLSLTSFAQSLRPATFDVVIGGQVKQGTLTYRSASVARQGVMVVTMQVPRIVVEGRTYFIASDESYANQITQWLCQKLYGANPQLGRVTAVYGTNYGSLGWGKKALVKYASDRSPRTTEGLDYQPEHYIDLLACNVSY